MKLKDGPFQFNKRKYSLVVGVGSQGPNLSPQSTMKTDLDALGHSLFFQPNLSQYYSCGGVGVKLKELSQSLRGKDVNTTNK